MLLASPLPCDILTPPTHRTSLISPLPFSSRQRTHSRSSSIPLNIQRTCNALQSLLAGNPHAPASVITSAPTKQDIPKHSPQNSEHVQLQSPAVIQQPLLAPAPPRPELRKRRASGLSMTTTKIAPKEEMVTTPQDSQRHTPKTPPSAPRGANKRRRSDSDDASRYDSNDASSAQPLPSTPKRQRRHPTELPQGLTATDFDSIPSDTELPPPPPTLLPRSHLPPPLQRRSSSQGERTVRQIQPQPPLRVLQRPQHHRRASSSAIMNLFFTHLQLSNRSTTPLLTTAEQPRNQTQQPSDPFTAIPNYEPPSNLEPNNAHFQPGHDHLYYDSPPNKESTSKTSTDLLLRAWPSSQLELIARNMAVSIGSNMRIRRRCCPRGTRPERARVDGCAVDWRQEGGS